MTLAPWKLLTLAAVAGYAFTTGRPAAGDTPGASTPPRRAHHQLVYDAGEKRILLIGGSTPAAEGAGHVFFDDVWSFDGARWTLKGSSGMPRSGQAIAYDSKRRQVFSFGGYCACETANSGRYADMLRLAGASWQTVSSIPDRPTTDAQMVYDAKRDRMVMFGGGGPRRTTHTDTWEFDGGAWTRTASSGPAQAYVMAFDGARGHTVMLGSGAQPPANAAAQTWIYDGSWRIAATEGPTPRHGAGVAYDSKRGLVMLFGGFAESGPLQDTWAWDGRRWTKLADDGPIRRGLGGMAYDASRDRLVLFGGRSGTAEGDLADTWEWDSVQWRRIE